MNEQSHSPNPGKVEDENHLPEQRLSQPDQLSAQFGAEGLSLKIALPKWAKTVIAILLAIGFLESIVVLKAIEIHDRYEQSQIAHNRLVKELREELEKAEAAKMDAETKALAEQDVRLFAKHINDNPTEVKNVSLASGILHIRVFPNDDVLILRSSHDGNPTASWLVNPSAK